jgi:drug/metabolite transporter (DMT)-like permease
MSFKGRATDMVNFLLYAVTVAIWGSTWLVITFQLHGSSAATAVAWRFLSAALLLLVWCRLRKINLRFAPSHYIPIALLGVANFSINYWLFYLAEIRIPSGLVAVIFTTLLIFNMIGARLFFGQSITLRAGLGALIGLSGILLVFWPEISRFDAGSRALEGLLLALGGTICASAGNLLAVKTRALGIGVIPNITIGMSVGGVLMAAIAWFSGDSLQIPVTTSFLLPLVYLSLFGSIVAFIAYLTLIGRIGAGPASYNGVLIPIVALLLSTVYEGYRWQAISVIGVLLALAGNILVMQGRKGEK